MRTSWRNGDDVVIEHREGQSPEALPWLLFVVIEYRISCISWNPATFQSFQLPFFEWMFSSINSAITTFLEANFTRNAARQHKSEYNGEITVINCR
jgi:hypothetical protein